MSRAGPDVACKVLTDSHHGNRQKDFLCTSNSTIKCSHKSSGGALAGGHGVCKYQCMHARSRVLPQTSVFASTITVISSDAQMEQTSVKCFTD